ncbi:AAA family ATPase [Candidatus Woesearchaeota archaeon]|nr:AAA family ATPase [Candidatus Woesearchaeota archaeon]
MTRFIGILAGKGGTGKTTTSINLGAAISYFGREAIVVDGNLTTPNVGLHLGVPVVPINLHHVLQGKNKIIDAVYMHPSGTKIVPASISIKDLKYSYTDKLKKSLFGLNGLTEIVLIDGAAGLGREATAAMEAADELIIVTNPEMPAITDALKTIKLANELGKEVIGVVVTKTKKDPTDVSIKNIETILEVPVIAVVPEDRSVREALVKRDAVIYTHPRSPSAVAYKRLAASLLGVKYKGTAEKEGLFMHILKALGLI